MPSTMGRLAWKRNDTKLGNNIAFSPELITTKWSPAFKKYLAAWVTQIVLQSLIA